MALAHPLLVEAAQRTPLFADLNGALQLVDSMREIVRDVRAEIDERARVIRAVTADRVRDDEADGAAADTGRAEKDALVVPRANVRVEMPPLPERARRETLSAAKGLVDLDRVVVVFGFGEVGPYGNARTRWEIESYGEFSLEGCVELAWMCGLIRVGEDGGWYFPICSFVELLRHQILSLCLCAMSLFVCIRCDASSGESVPEQQIKARYEPTLLKHSGIRLLEPELFDDYDPHKKMFLRAVALQNDVGPLEVSEAEATQFVRQHGADKCAAWRDEESGQVSVLSKF